MKNNYVFIAEVFRNRRIKLGYSKRKLASLVGISDTELSRIEHGERENYNLITLINMCRVLKIDFISLLESAGYLSTEYQEPSNEVDDINDEEEVEEEFIIPEIIIVLELCNEWYISD